MVIQSSICDGLSGLLPCAHLDLTEVTWISQKHHVKTQVSSTLLPCGLCCTIKHVQYGVLRPDRGLALSPVHLLSHSAFLGSPNMSPTFSPLLFYFCAAVCSACKPLSILFHLTNSCHPSGKHFLLPVSPRNKECIPPTAPQTHLCT